MTTRETRIREEPAGRADPADPAGNERLTAMTGAVLLVLFGAECLTLLNLGQLLTLHFFLGMLSGRADHARHLLAARSTRWLLLCGALAGGLALALATYHLSGQWGGSGSIIP